jgi:hypothetical protein
MSNLHKSNWNVSGNRVSLSVPFAKIDEEKRLVSGFATLDNIDSQGDVVLAEASTAAFARARGNIREMHQPIAAGRMVDFQEESFFHPDPVTGEQKMYRGIFVTAYVSKGAESTWEKVLDGTLTGFSIGGEIREHETQYVEDVQKTVRFVKDYDLVELSLVDNPANPLANIFSIQKSADGSVTKVNGIVADTRIENVFYCNHDKVARTLNSESAACLMCGTTMENIGWVEVGAEMTEKVKSLVEGYMSKSTSTGPQVQYRIEEGKITTDTITSGRIEAIIKDAEGGKTVADEQVNTPNEGEAVPGVDERETVEGEETQVDGATPSDDPGQTENVDETGNVEDEPQEGDVVAGVDEVPTQTDELQKKMDSLLETIQKSLEQNREDTKSQVQALEVKLGDFSKAIDDKISELDTKVSEFDTSLAAAKGAVSEFEKNLEKYNSGTAIKKSGEVETPAPEPVQKDDAWNGAFSIRDVFGRS